MPQRLPSTIIKMYSELSDRDKTHMGIRFKERYKHVTSDRFQKIARGRADDLTFDEFEFVQKLIKDFYQFKKQIA